jgi:NTP pyrophosphatase (non-canonical NTP hydrolase)
MLHLIARADKRDQDVAEFVDSYSKTIAALCRRLEALERGANDLLAPEAPADDSPVADGDLPARVLAMCRQRNWSLDWTCRGAYLHLESSELIEALRGKRGDPKAEAADVLLVLMSITENAGIPWGDVLEQVAATCTQLENCGRYSGEEWTALVEDAKGTESDSVADVAQLITDHASRAGLTAQDWAKAFNAAPPVPRQAPSAANDPPAAPDPVEPEIEVCKTCDGEGTIDERLGGISTSNPAATCPDCDGVGEPRWLHRQAPAAPTPPPTALVEVVGNELPLLPGGRVDEARTRALIYTVAAWLDTQGDHFSGNCLRTHIDRWLPPIESKSPIRTP